MTKLTELSNGDCYNLIKKSIEQDNIDKTKQAKSNSMVAHARFFNAKLQYASKFNFRLCQIITFVVNKIPIVGHILYCFKTVSNMVKKVESAKKIATFINKMKIKNNETGQITTVKDQTNNKHSKDNYVTFECIKVLQQNKDRLIFPIEDDNSTLLLDNDSAKTIDEESVRKPLIKDKPTKTIDKEVVVEPLIEDKPNNIDKEAVENSFKTLFNTIQDTESTAFSDSSVGFRYKNTFEKLAKDKSIGVDVTEKDIELLKDVTSSLESNILISKDNIIRNLDKLACLISVFNSEDPSKISTFLTSSIILNSAYYIQEDRAMFGEYVNKILELKSKKDNTLLKALVLNVDALMKQNNDFLSKDNLYLGHTILIPEIIKLRNKATPELLKIISPAQLSNVPESILATTEKHRIIIEKLGSLYKNRECEIYEILSSSLANEIITEDSDNSDKIIGFLNRLNEWSVYSLYDYLAKRIAVNNLYPTSDNALWIRKCSPKFFEEVIKEKIKANQDLNSYISICELGDLDALTFDQCSRVLTNNINQDTKDHLQSIFNMNFKKDSFFRYDYYNSMIKLCIAGVGNVQKFMDSELHRSEFKRDLSSKYSHKIRDFLFNIETDKLSEILFGNKIKDDNKEKTTEFLFLVAKLTAIESLKSDDLQNFKKIISMAKPIIDISKIRTENNESLLELAVDKPSNFTSILIDNQYKLSDKDLYQILISVFENGNIDLINLLLSSCSYDVIMNSKYYNQILDVALKNEHIATWENLILIIENHTAKDANEVEDVKNKINFSMQKIIEDEDIEPQYRLQILTLLMQSNVISNMVTAETVEYALNRHLADDLTILLEATFNNYALEELLQKANNIVNSSDKKHHNDTKNCMNIIKQTISKRDNAKLAVATS